jgi:hypothetical protein
MGELIDLSLVRTSKRLLNQLLETKGLNYFLRQESARPFQLEPAKVELLVRTASRLSESSRRSEKVIEHARGEIRKELIRQVVSQMLQLGL